MMRYASRPAMAESRIVSYNKETDEVHWFYDDHKTEKRVDVYETGKDLLKKMFIHIPEDHFQDGPLLWLLQQQRTGSS